MKRCNGWTVLTLFLCVLAIGMNAWGQTTPRFGNSPVKNNGEKWRIGYYEGGPYIDYQKNLVALVQGLMELNWIQSEPIPPQETESNQALWKWLAEKAKSDYLQFAPDAFYSAEWKDDVREKMSGPLIERLKTREVIDLMLALGTWAGQDLATEAHSVPTLVMSTSDPLKAGIIKSIEDSGLDHVHARVDPYRYERQIRIFHDIIGFNKLGVAYENTQTGRTYAAMDKVEAIAEERGFKVVPCFTIDDTPDQKAAQDSVLRCIENLVKTADAIYISKQNGVNDETLPQIVAIVNEAGLPTFTQSGSKEVRAGLLMSISKASYVHLGRFLAETAAQILNGANPRQLPQVFEGPPKIAINLRTAEIIGYDPPVDVLSAADEIFQEIAAPK